MWSGRRAETMNIVIVGAGEIGRHLAVSLSKEAHSIVVIENDAHIASELEQQIDARGLLVMELWLLCWWRLVWQSVICS